MCAYLFLSSVLLGVRVTRVCRTPAQASKLRLSAHSANSLKMDDHEDALWDQIAGTSTDAAHPRRNSIARIIQKVEMVPAAVRALRVPAQRLLRRGDSSGGGSGGSPPRGGPLGHSPSSSHDYAAFMSSDLEEEEQTQVRQRESRRVCVSLAAVVVDDGRGRLVTWGIFWGGPSPAVTVCMCARSAVGGW